MDQIAVYIGRIMIRYVRSLYLRFVFFSLSIAHSYSSSLFLSLSATKQKQNNYPLTVVSESSMERLVELLVELLLLLLVLPRDAEEQLNRILISFKKEK